MPAKLLPYRAGYVISAPSGSAAGTEDLKVARAHAGWLIQSSVQTSWPEEIAATIDWELDEAMLTRLLHIRSQERFSGDHELELTVTGNGLLAHRSAPDGPTQVELGWGPDAELDYISAAFPTVMLARKQLPRGAVRNVDAVVIGTADLVPAIVPLRLRGLPLAAAPPAARGEIDHPATGLVECLVLATGHLAQISTTTSGALLGYSGLLRLAWLEPTK